MRAAFKLAGGVAGVSLLALVVWTTVEGDRRGHVSELLEPLVINGAAVQADSPANAAINAIAAAGLSKPKTTGSVECEDCEDDGVQWDDVRRDGHSTIRVNSGVYGRRGRDVTIPTQQPVETGPEKEDASTSFPGSYAGIAKDVAGKVIGSFIHPEAGLPLTWSQHSNNRGTQYQGTTEFTLPNVVGPGKSVNPVQVNARIVFPKPESPHQHIPNPCPHAPGGCPDKVYTEEDMQDRLQAERHRVDERLADERKIWEEKVLATKQRYRERLQALIQRSDALANKVRHLEAGGGTRMDLPEYVRVRNRVAGMSDAVAKLIADENLLQTHMNHVLEEPGPKGIRGAPGVQGAEGLAGVQGPPGPRGTPGRDGHTGKRGKDGPSGMPGPPGPPGPPGVNGVDGQDGPEGPMGRPGLQGNQGPQGPQGPPGRAGPNGKDGDDGKQGEPGPPGFDGKDGTDGKDGAEGPPGRQGPPGPPGRQGVPGHAGQSGPEGVQGPRGPPGLQGPQGLPGLPGPPGPQGDVGPRGPQGRNGANGSPGREGPPSPPVLAVEPPSPPVPRPAPPGTAAPGAAEKALHAPMAYTKSQYEPIISAAVASAMSQGCGCAKTAAPVAKAQCQCVKQQLAAMREQGDDIKSALAQVARAARPGQAPVSPRAAK